MLSSGWEDDGVAEAKGGGWGVGAFSRCIHRNHKYQVTEDLTANEERQCSTDLLGLGPFFSCFDVFNISCIRAVAQWPLTSCMSHTGRLSHWRFWSVSCDC